MIGMILLIGTVKQNAILMIDLRSLALGAGTTVHAQESLNATASHLGKS